ncbi:MAG: cytochrome c oxidase subunit II, partial [Actinomycetota bacterium]|nr:cytochrome c oxidase subunit II [Actinomycetota bacterium]
MTSTSPHLVTRALRRLPIAAGPALLLLSACADERQDIFTPQGDSAEKINRLQVPVFGIAGLVGVLVLGGILVLMRQGSRRHNDAEIDPVQLEGNFKLEIGWTIAPAVLLAVVAVFTVATLLDLDDVDAAPPPELGEMEISVYGHQWWWSYEYEMNPSDTSPENTPEIVTANDLVIPAGVPIRLNIRSRDVIHSFWIPSLAGTRDAVPGRSHDLVIQADEPGVYDGQCKEFCGLSHANMKQRVVALSMPEFQTWLEQQQETQPLLEEGDVGYEGQQTFLAQCSTCHQINGLENADGEPIVVEGGAAVVSRYAPNLTHLMTRGVFAGALFDLWTTDEDGRPVVDRAQLEAWIRDPAAIKPMYDVV